MFSIEIFMKKNIKAFIFAIILLISMSFYACHKEDNTFPILKLNGKDTVTINLNETYTDAGATASDDIDLDLTKSIFVKNEVNINKVGTYKVLFSVSDKAGNVAPTKTRIVHVINNSSIYIGNYAANVYIYYPNEDSAKYSTQLIIDSTKNNKLLFTKFSDTLTKKPDIFGIVSGSTIEIPLQKTTISYHTSECTFQGYGTIDTSGINLIYFKSYKNTVYSCKANFLKQKK